jgi:phytoene desaturase
LAKLSPSYRVFFHGGQTMVDVYDELEKNRDVFEKLESGSTDVLADYIKKAQYQYEIAMKDFVPKNYDSVFDFFTRRTITEGYKLHVFENMQKYAERYFKTVEMQKIVQYPLVFLGTAPQDAPALYNIMTYVDFGMGVWYPQ